MDATISGEGISGEVASTTISEQGVEGDLPKGFTIGEYVIEDVLGRGGFGTVYRATQPVIGKRVAIKVLSRKYSADDAMVSRFTAEAKAVNQIRHRHIIDIFSFGQIPNDGRQYYVMELLDGEPLDQYLASHGPLRLDQALPILRGIARALDAAHAKGVAHRDLKPENVFLATDDDGSLFPKLLDFGIAKLNNPDEALAHKTNTGVPIGTPYYMSPEQCRGQNVDHRTDLYSFGVVTYRMLTGKFPFDGALVDILHHHMHDPPPAASSKKDGISPAVDAAIAWMLHKDPDARPKTAIAAVVALQDDKMPTPVFSSGMGSDFPATGNASRAGKRSWLIPVLALLVIAAGAAVFAITRKGDGDTLPPPAEPRPAVAPATLDAAPPVATVIDAPPAKTHVIVDVRGVPDGTDVMVGKTVVGTAPGPVQLDKSDEAMVLSFRADGYLPKSDKITPNKDQTLTVTGMKRRPSGARPTRPQNPDDPDALIDVFGKEKKP